MSKKPKKRPALEATADELMALSDQEHSHPGDPDAEMDPVGMITDQEQALFVRRVIAQYKERRKNQQKEGEKMENNEEGRAYLSKEEMTELIATMQRECWRSGADGIAVANKTNEVMTKLINAIPPEYITEREALVVDMVVGPRGNISNLELYGHNPAYIDDLYAAINERELPSYGLESSVEGK